MIFIEKIVFGNFMQIKTFSDIPGGEIQIKYNKFEFNQFIPYANTHMK